MLLKKRRKQGMLFEIIGHVNRRLDPTPIYYVKGILVQGARRRGKLIWILEEVADSMDLRIRLGG